MFKVVVKNLDGVVLHAPAFELESEAVAHKNLILEKNEWNFPEGFTVDVEDITEAVAYDREMIKRIHRINFAVEVFAELATRNVRRLKAGQTTLADILSVESKMAQVQRRMLNSTTEIALQEMQQMDLPELPAEEKQYFINKIQNYLAGE
ncbi:hypothetical protein ACES2L_06065 [Bdellovibrio bacteriovorus]